MLGIALMLTFWSRGAKLQERSQQMGEASLFAKDVDGFIDSLRSLVRITDLALTSEDTRAGTGGGFPGSTYLAREALTHLEIAATRAAGLQSTTGPPVPPDLLPRIEDSIESLREVVRNYLEMGPAALNNDGRASLDRNVALLSSLVDRLAIEVNLGTAEISRAVDAERVALKSIGILAALAYLLLVALSWSWVSNKAIAPLQKLTKQARTADECGLPMHLRPEGPAEVIDLIQSVGSLVNHLQNARTNLEGRVQDRTASLEHALDELRAEKASLHRVEGKLAQKEYELFQSQKMEAIGRLAGGVAHDFNNLLTVVSGCAELLHERLADDPDALDEVDQIRQAGERAASLTRQLLMFGKNQPAHPEVFDLNSVLDDIQKMMVRLLGESIQIRTDLSSAPCTLVADRGQIESVLVNLAANARDAMPDGGSLEFRTMVLEDAGLVRLLVEDVGIGMEKAVAARIFEPFYSTKPASKGSGLGLATVYGIVKQAGGSIKVDTCPGEGSCFTLEFPLCPDAAPAPQPPAALPASPSSRSSNGSASEGSERVLFVEDEPTLLRLFTHELRERGYNVREASNGTEALERIDDPKANFDILVTDYRLPGANGLDLAQRARTRFPGIRILCVTGSIDFEPTTSEGSSVGASVHLLRKPFTSSGLCKKVREVLDV